MASGMRWDRGREDLVPLLLLALPMAVWALLGGSRTPLEEGGVATALAIGYLLKHALPLRWADLAVLAPVAGLAVELSTLPVASATFLLAPLAGIGLLVWTGADPAGGATVRQQVEPALVPALAVGVAVAVMQFLPGSSGGQVGLAAVALVAVLGLAAWLYARSAAESTDARPTV